METLENENEAIEHRREVVEPRDVANMVDEDESKGEDQEETGESSICSASKLSPELSNDILNTLKTHPKKRLQQKWLQAVVDKLSTELSSANSLMKLTVDELNVVIEKTVPLQQQQGTVIKKSLLKSDKVKALAKLIIDGTEAQRYVKAVMTLKQISLKAVRKQGSKNSTTKEMLNGVYATLVFPEERRKWEQQGTVAPGTKIAELDEPDFWFSFPEWNSGLTLDTLK